MKLGISSYTYTWGVGSSGFEPANPIRPIDLLHKAKDLGVKVIQFADNMPLIDLGEKELKSFEEMASSLSIDIELGTRGISFNNFEKHISLAERLNSKIVRTVVDTDEKEPEEDETVYSIKRILKLLEKSNITLAIENHDRLSSVELVNIIKRINSEYVGICLDTANSYGALEGIKETTKKLAPWIVNIHMKDFVIFRCPHKMGFNIEGRPAGGGMIDIDWLLQKLMHFNRDPNVIIELWTPPETILQNTIEKEEEWAKESIQYMRTLIEG